MQLSLMVLKNKFLMVARHKKLQIRLARLRHSQFEPPVKRPNERSKYFEDFLPESVEIRIPRSELEKRRLLEFLPRNKQQPDNVKCNAKQETISKNISPANKTEIKKGNNNKEEATQTGTIRNPMGIQLISRNLHRQLFRRAPRQTEEALNEADVDRSKQHLSHFDLWNKTLPPPLPDVNLQLPKLSGDTLDSHLRHIGQQQIEPYRSVIQILQDLDIPQMPTTWEMKEGWTWYKLDGSRKQVSQPSGHAVVLDVEVCMSQGQAPTLATAVSPEGWYGWCSGRLCQSRQYSGDYIGLRDLIPLEYRHPNIMIGHNVAFDRSYIRSQYYIQGSKTRFLDTMSLHIGVGGLTRPQRAILDAKINARSTSTILMKKAKARMKGANEWEDTSSFSSLKDVYKHYIGEDLQKSDRDVFVHGDLSEVREKFQDMMAYCARDVVATLQVFQKLWPMYLERFPHPVTLAGMLEMGTAYLPVTDSWDQYIDAAEEQYDDMRKESQMLLVHQANDACQLMDEQRYKEDPWLWNLDWSTKKIRIKKTKGTKKETVIEDKAEKECSEECEEQIQRPFDEKYAHLLETRSNLYKKQPRRPGYPTWYADLCTSQEDDSGSRNVRITSNMGIAPKLLKLTWQGFPLHFCQTHGWGYLVPGRYTHVDEKDHLQFPLKTFLQFCIEFCKPSPELINTFPEFREWDALVKCVDPEIPRFREVTQKLSELQEKLSLDGRELVPWPPWHRGNGPFDDVKIPGCFFFKLPHKDGPENRVANPLAKDFGSKIESGLMSTASGARADRALRMNSTVSYWRNNRERIMSQMVVWLEGRELNKSVISDPEFDANTSYGVILPKVVVSGTVTRRAVERTWLTASNARSNRLGSELKAMVRAPPGYRIVGADVDSQELWIAALLGDAKFTGIHGGTAMGWMLLQGDKASGTDMHSKTASTLGVSRDQAKVFNYSRIYGAGLKHAKLLLMQFLHDITSSEAESRANQLYALTKGRRMFRLGSTLAEEADAFGADPKGVFTSGQLRRTLNLSSNISELEEQGLVKREWSGGTESAMFTRLEEIATSEEPQTPVLKAGITTALMPQNVGNSLLTTRVNWVVQSSAVDYLHILLVCVRWLAQLHGIKMRLMVTVHDEVRYLVREEDRYLACLALQIANLVTRSVFCESVGLTDLPMSVAFFSSVEIDRVLRKDCSAECTTPSNPHGMTRGYGVSPGEALDISQLLSITGPRFRAKTSRSDQETLRT